MGGDLRAYLHEFRERAGDRGAFLFPHLADLLMVLGQRDAADEVRRWPVPVPKGAAEPHPERLSSG